MEIYEYEITNHITLKPIRVSAGAYAKGKKDIVVLYLDKDSVEKSN
jgi:hypothetical protein